MMSVGSLDVRTNPSPPLSFSIREDGVALVRYDVPRNERNVLEPGFVEELSRTFNDLLREPAVRAVVLASGKRGSWIAGASPTLLRTLLDAPHPTMAAEQMSRAGQQLLARLEAFPKPVVAAIQGVTFGGGVEIALACHARVLADDRTTLLSLPEVELGLLPAMSGAQRLAALTGLARALDCVLTGRVIRPDLARSMGLADAVVAASQLEAEATILALRMAQRGDFLRVPRLAESAQERERILHEARAEVRRTTRGHYPAPERILDVLEAFSREGFEASQSLEARAFGELVASNTCRRLIDVFFDATSARLDPGGDAPRLPEPPPPWVTVIGDDDVARAVVGWSERGGLVTSSLQGKAREMGLARPEVERQVAVVTGLEDTEAARGWLRAFEHGASDKVVIACDVTRFPVRLLEDGMLRPERVVGVRYGGAGTKARWLEIVRPNRAADDAITAVVAMGKRQAKTVWVVGPRGGGYVPRLVGALLDEVNALIQEGARPADIQEAMFAWGWGEPLLTWLPRSDGEPRCDRAEGERMARRCSLRVVNEAYRCLGEGVLRNERDGSLAAIEALGFPRFRGGPFRYVIDEGASNVVDAIEALQRELGDRWAPAPALRRLHPAARARTA